MKRKYFLTLLFALVGSSLLLTCNFSLPPYDEGLSLGIETARKMMELGAKHVTVGPINIWDFGVEDREFYFIPNKGIVDDDFKSGFIAVEDDRSFGLSYVDHMGGDIYDLWGIGGTDLTNSDDKTLNLHAETIKWGPFLSFIRFDAGDYRNNHYYLIEWPPPFPPDWMRLDLHLRSFLHADVFSSDPARNPTIIGSSIWPKPSALGYDHQVFFCRFDGNGRYAEVRYETEQISGLKNGSIFNNDMEFSFPDDFDNAFYFHNQMTLTSYLSYYSPVQRKFKNYSWPNLPDPPLKPLVDMDRRIDAVVSTGRLLSFENSRCYVYDEEGYEQFDFLLGGLHFCYEIELDFFGIPTNCLVFTLPAWLGLWDQDDELYFNVYAFPTDLIEKLK